MSQPFDPSTVRVPSRAEIRAAVTRDAATLRRAALRGGNHHQLALDQRDRAEQYAAAVAAVHGPDAAAQFLATWREELDAVTAHTVAETERSVARARRRAASAQADADLAGWQAAGRVVGPLVFLLAVWWFFLR